MATFTLSSSLLPKPLTPLSHSKPFTPTSSLHIQCCSLPHWNPTLATKSRPSIRVAAVDGDFSARRSSSNSNEPRETIMLPGCDYNHWLIVMEFPKDPAPTREQMIDTYLNTLATVLGRFGFFIYYYYFTMIFLVCPCLRVCVCVWEKKNMHYYESLDFFFLFPRDDTELIYNWVNEKRVFSSYDFECSSMRNLGFFWPTHFLAKKDVT